MVAWHRQLDVSAMTRTLWRFEPACYAAVVLELAELGGVESARDGVEEGVEGEGGGDALGGEGADVGGEEEGEVDAGQLRRHWLRRVHCGLPLLFASLKWFGFAAAKKMRARVSPFYLHVRL